MEHLDAEQLQGYLVKKGMDPELAVRLKDEGINGDVFLAVSSEVLRACGFKAGEIVTICKYSKLPYEEENRNDTAKNTSLNDENPPEDGDQSYEMNSGSNTSNVNDLDGSVDEDEYLSGLELAQHAELSEYFTPSEFDDMSTYDKNALYTQLSRYKKAVETVGPEKALMCKPHFVKHAELVKAKKDKKNSLPSSKIDSANKENINPRRTSLRKQSERQADKTQERLGSVSDLEQMVLNTSEKESTRPKFKSQITVGPTASTSGNILKTNNDKHRASTSGTSNKWQDESGTSKSSSDSDVGEDANDTELPFDLSQEVELTGQRLKVASMDENLPKYDMLKILNDIYLDAKEDLKCAIRSLKKSNQSNIMLPRLQRVRVMRAITLYLFNTISNGKKPTPDMKEGLAKSFVLAFNAYLLPLTKEQKPWSLVYDRKGTGYLASSCRAPEKPFKKKRKTDKKTVLLEPTSEYDSDYVKELSVLMPDRSNKSAILDAMANTFPMRNKERANRLGVFEFIEKYPHFASFEGEVLREEFQRLQPTARDMSGEFTRLLPEILKLQEKVQITMDCEDDTLRALQLISQNLPHDVTRKGGSSWAKLGDVVEIMKQGQDLETYAAEKGEPGVPIQPYLISVKAIIGKRIARNFLVLDRKVMQLPPSTLKALDTLIKAYHVFNVRYPAGWHNTFHFFSVCFYKVFEKTRKRTDSVTPSEHELFCQLGGKL